MMEICIDFDGTIVKHHYPNIGAPVPYALEYMRKFQDKGANLILFTMRSGLELQDAVNYIESNGVVLYGINENPTQKSWTESPKAYGQIYIDDAAFGCPLIHPLDNEDIDAVMYGNLRPYVDWSVVGPKVLGKIPARNL